MPNIDLFELRGALARYHVLTCFNGPFSHGLIEEFGVALRHHLEQRAAEHSTVLDVFAVYVELAQNIRTYLDARAFAAGPPHHPDCAIIGILWDGEHFAVGAGNVALRADAAALEGRIAELNGLDRDGLRRAYKAQLRVPHPPGAPGAGLGLLEVARRAALPLGVSRARLTDDWDFISILVRI